MSTIPERAREETTPQAWPILSPEGDHLHTCRTWQAATCWPSTARRKTALVILDHRGGRWTLDPQFQSWHPSGFPEQDEEAEG